MARTGKPHRQTDAASQARSPPVLGRLYTVLTDTRPPFALHRKEGEGKDNGKGERGKENKGDKTLSFLKQPEDSIVCFFNPLLSKATYSTALSFLLIALPPCCPLFHRG